MPTLPDLVVALFARQIGVAARRQLVALASAKAVDGWVRHGLLVKVHRGVYRIRGAPVSDEQALLAAVLRCGEGSAAGPRMSCALFGLEGFSLSDAIDVAVPMERRLTRVDFELVPMPITGADRCITADVPALHVGSSLIALAPSIEESAWRVAWDSARRKGLLTTGRMRSRALRSDDPGASVVLERLASGTLEPDGEGERRLQTVLNGFVPQPEWGVETLVPGRRLDCAWCDIRLALEYDGRDHHVLPTDRDSDGMRDLECELHDVTVIRITKGMLDADSAAVREMIERIYFRRVMERAAGLPT